MDSQPQNTAERPVSRPREEIIKEAKRMEESLLYSSKGHFAASGIWSNFHLGIGIPAAILAAIASAAALRKFDPEGIASAVCSMIVVVLTALMTFLNPNSKASAHLNAGNSYDSLMNRVRIFWSIDCWREADEVLVEAAESPV